MKIPNALRAKSAIALARIEGGLPNIMTFWFIAAIAASTIRIATSPLHSIPDSGTFWPYVLVVGAPLVSMGLALNWFQRGDELPLPAIRLPSIGRWKPVRLGQARRHPLYGSSGIMLSLVVGMLLNVPVRTLEYMASVPALSGSVPSWLSTLRLAMTLDVVLLSSLYTICFVAALRRVPAFPRLLFLTWLVDAGMQWGIARVVAAGGELPAGVGNALHALLDGNITKVMISAMLWMPYLLMSRRVNLTFRRRVASRG